MSLKVLIRIDRLIDKTAFLKHSTLCRASNKTSNASCTIQALCRVRVTPSTGRSFELKSVFQQTILSHIYDISYKLISIYLVNLNVNVIKYYRAKSQK